MVRAGDRDKETFPLLARVRMGCRQLKLKQQTFVVNIRPLATTIGCMGHYSVARFHLSSSLTEFLCTPMCVYGGGTIPQAGGGASFGNVPEGLEGNHYVG